MPEPPRNAFQYAIVRVLPRVERGESLNVGVVLLCRPARFLGARIALDEKRLAAFAPDLDPATIRPHLEAIERIAAGDPTAGPIARLGQAERFHWLVVAVEHDHPAVRGPRRAVRRPGGRARPPRRDAGRLARLRSAWREAGLGLGEGVLEPAVARRGGDLDRQRDALGAAVRGRPGRPARAARRASAPRGRRSRGAAPGRLSRPVRTARSVSRASAPDDVADRRAIRSTTRARADARSDRAGARTPGGRSGRGARASWRNAVAQSWRVSRTSGRRSRPAARGGRGRGVGALEERLDVPGRPLVRALVVMVLGEHELARPSGGGPGSRRRRDQRVRARARPVYRPPSDQAASSSNVTSMSGRVAGHRLDVLVGPGLDDLGEERRGARPRR